MSAVIDDLSITPATLQRWLQDGQELAVLDLRSTEAFAKGEPLYATNLPADRLLAEVHRFVPRKQVRTVLVDDGEGEAHALAGTLRERGWLQVFALEGGVHTWARNGRAGLPTFDTPGLDFSLAVREERSTPVRTATELRALREQQADVVVLDTRTAEEFERGHVPGAINAPGAELLARFADLVPSPATQVLISCAGLPRAILGAQTLIDAQVPNAVAYLDHGTRGWTDIGGTLETGIAAAASAAPASAQSRHLALQHVQHFGDPAWPELSIGTARAWLRDAERTSYLLDVRSPEEFAAGSLPDAISAPGGQLLGVSHRTLAVRGARVILLDDPDGLRARTTAHWLQRRGFEIALLLHACVRN